MAVITTIFLHDLRILLLFAYRFKSRDEWWWVFFHFFPISRIKNGTSSYLIVNWRRRSRVQVTSLISNHLNRAWQFKGCVLHISCFSHILCPCHNPFNPLNKLPLSNTHFSLSRFFTDYIYLARVSFLLSVAK